ncbi:MAG TPA: CopG family transcriptional regulator [Idiomarina loihiensis]|nr:CopG family transcriptional regulator [Idiomarinaceae bacterium]HAS22965.1 CopG family transcriptional regulator [Idiomarina loihiensis]
MTLTEQSGLWLCHHVQEFGEYNSKNELVSDLIRRAKAINEKLKSAEANGFTDQSPEEMLQEFKPHL